MKIWRSYGTEHSANLVMIGRFKDVASAEKAKSIIDEVSRVIGELDVSDASEYPSEVVDLFRRLQCFTVTPNELEQFRYDVAVSQDGSEVRLSTDEIDVSGFLKLLIDNGAKVEVYSAHDYPENKAG